MTLLELVLKDPAPCLKLPALLVGVWLAKLLLAADTELLAKLLFLWNEMVASALEEDIPVLLEEEPEVFMLFCAAAASLDVNRDVRMVGCCLKEPSEIEDVRY